MGIACREDGVHNFFSRYLHDMGRTLWKSSTMKGIIYPRSNGDGGFRSKRPSGEGKSSCFSFIIDTEKTECIQNLRGVAPNDYAPVHVNMVCQAMSTVCR